MPDELSLREYHDRDFSPFNPAPAIYFMNGWSRATVRLRGSDEKFGFEWRDRFTSIATSAPITFDPGSEDREYYAPLPSPLRPVAKFPTALPRKFSQRGAMHVLQVVSMDMRSSDGASRLLIGLPYAQEYPGLFFGEIPSGSERSGAASFGTVASLQGREAPSRRWRWWPSRPRNRGGLGYPARSAFAVYHILESPIGALFNKKPTVMELQPDDSGRLALTIPPPNFLYRLVNGPIPLYLVDEPNDDPIAEIEDAFHGNDSPRGEDWVVGSAWLHPGRDQ